MKVGDALQLANAKYTVVGLDDDGSIDLMGPGTKTNKSRLRYIEAVGKWHHGRYLSRGGKNTWYHRDGDRFTAAY